MESHAISQELRAFIIDNYLMGREDGLKDDDSFLDKGIIDSTGVLELVAFLEDSYGFKVDNEELVPENLDSILQVTKYVRSKLPVSSPGAAPA